MLQEIMGTLLVLMVYVCFVIVVFSPTLYAVWLYVMGRRVSLKARGLLKLAILTFVINTVVACVLAKMAFDFFVTAKVAEWQTLTRTSIQNAVVSQERFYKSHGRYYPVGPVRGPYKDDQGLSVEKDVILQVTPEWDTEAKRETFQAYAVHVLAKGLLRAAGDGKVEQPPPDSDESVRVKSKLFNSVK
jgi:hypothetical protein